MKRRYSDQFTSLPALVLDVDIVATGTDRLPYSSITYYGTIVVESRSFDVEMATQDRPYVLLGRDIINQFVLHADGPAEIFELTWPPPPPSSSAKRRRLRKR